MVKLSELRRSENGVKFRGDMIDIDLEARTMNGGNNNNDASNSNNNDQLPTVDEYRVDQGLSGSHNMNMQALQEKARYCAKRAVVFCIPIAFLITVFTLGLWLSDGSGQAEVLLGSEASSEVFVAAPTTAPVLDENSRVDSVVAFIKANDYYTDPIDIDTLQSPQWNAAVWIADHDPNRLPLQDNLDFRQRYALAVFYFATKGKYWNYMAGSDNDINSSNNNNNDEGNNALKWLSGSDVCNWNQIWNTRDIEFPEITVGVSCDCAGSSGCDRNTVKQIVLPKFGLTGTLPPELGLLSHMQILNLHDNNIQSFLPPQLQHCQSLQSIILSRNNISGGIPLWLPTALPNLQLVNFAHNPLGGGVPASFDKLKSRNNNLAVVNFSDCKLSGSMNALTSLSNLEALFLESNSLEGSLTNEMLASWPKLSVLDISGNGFKGDLPSNLFDYSTGSNDLVVIDLHDNQFSGDLPTINSSNSDIKLEFLALHNNDISGSIPDNIFRLSQLRHLDLSDNKLVGDIPGNIGGLVKLEYLFLANNPTLTQGPIPDAIGNLGSLKDLSLKSTNRRGPIPGRIGTLPDLTLLDLEHNQLLGQVPAQFSLATSLRFLLLAHNFLSGDVPVSIINALDKLEVVLLDHNDFGGSTIQVCSTTSANAKSISKLSNFVTDCAPRGVNANNFVEVTCPCCNVCCHDDASEACYKEDWLGTLDPVWDQPYVREYYAFDEDRIVFPGSGSASDAGGVETTTSLDEDFVNESSSIINDELYKKVQWNQAGNWGQAEQEFYSQVTPPPISTVYNTPPPFVAPTPTSAPSPALPPLQPYDGVDGTQGTDPSGPGPSSPEELSESIATNSNSDTDTNQDLSAENQQNGAIVAPTAEDSSTVDESAVEVDTDTQVEDNAVDQGDGTTNTEPATDSEVIQENVTTEETPVDDGSNQVADTPVTPTTTLIEDNGGGDSFALTSPASDENVIDDLEDVEEDPPLYTSATNSALPTSGQDGALIQSAPIDEEPVSGNGLEALGSNGGTRRRTKR